MDNKSISDKFSELSPETQEKNAKIFEDIRQRLSAARLSMTDVKEVTQPGPKMGIPNPDAAAAARLSPEFQTKIEAIQKGGVDYYSNPTPEASPVSPPATPSLVAEPIAPLEPVMPFEPVLLEPIIMEPVIIVP